MALAGASLMTQGCATSPHVRVDDRILNNLARLPYHALAESLPQEQDYECRIEGRLPDGLQGSLYRNGPGLFDRGGLRKRTILDGDGLIQHFRFHGGGVHYRTRFVQTEKYRSESAAGHYIHPSWSTQAPGGWWPNFWITLGIKSQAGITVYLVDGRLYAFDESSFPYELDPATLSTVGETTMGVPREETIYSAHPKIDPRNGEWLHFGVRYGVTPLLQLTVFRPGGALAWRRSIPLPRFVYIHDWFVSTNYLMVSLQPVEIDFWPALLGLRSISDSLRWRPEKGNLLLVIPRDPVAPPIQLEAPACFMWHSINAFDEGGRITADFIGYDNPDHFVGHDPVISAVMQGRDGEHSYPGLVRRYRIDVKEKKVSSEIIAEGSYEWPSIDEHHLCGPYHYAYMCEASPGSFFWNGLARFNSQSSRLNRYYFGEQVFCSEPIFVSKPQGRDSEGWLLSECLDSRAGTSFLAVLDAQRLEQGPLARVHLRHHCPFSFHGFWQAAA